MCTLISQEPTYPSIYAVFNPRPLDQLPRTLSAGSPDAYPSSEFRLWNRSRPSMGSYSVPPPSDWEDYMCFRRSSISLTTLHFQTANLAWAVDQPRTNVRTPDVCRRLKARTSLILLACLDGRKEYQPWICSSFQSQLRIYFNSAAL